MRFQFIKSAVLPKDYPRHQQPELVVAGRSNAGKSSFLNAVARTKIAKTSSTPGKTRTINFFKTDQGYHFVDLPGYGYAARSAKERKEWGQMIENYFSVRSNILGVLLIMDIRRNWQDEEDHLGVFLGGLDIPMAVILTKADKLSRMQQQKSIRKMRELLDSELVFAVSSTKKQGISEVLKFCKDHWLNG